VRLNPRISGLENFRDPGIRESRDPAIAIPTQNPLERFCIVPGHSYSLERFCLVALAELLIILPISAHVMSRCELDLWPLPLDLELLQHFECPVFKLCTKFERNQIIHG